MSPPYGTIRALGGRNLKERMSVPVVRAECAQARWVDIQRCCRPSRQPPRSVVRAVRAVVDEFTRLSTGREAMRQEEGEHESHGTRRRAQVGDSRVAEALAALIGADVQGDSAMGSLVVEVDMPRRPAAGLSLDELERCAEERDG